MNILPGVSSQIKYLLSRTISDKLSIGKPHDPTSTSFLAAKADAACPQPAFIGRRTDFLQHQEKKTPFPIRLSLTQGPIWDSELDYRWRGKDFEASVGREGSPKLLIYILSFTIPYIFILISVCTNKLLFFKLLQLICFPFSNKPSCLTVRSCHIK